jgi:hypothetical protein
MIDLNRQTIRNQPAHAREGICNTQILKWCGLFAMLAVFVGWSIYVRNQILLVQYDLEQVTRENLLLAEQNQMLRAEFKSMLSPGQIEGEARRLGMVNPNQPGVVVLEGDPYGQPVRTYAQSRTTPKVMHE